MRWDIRSAAIELVQGDITREKVDCLVNAANSKLAGGGGVDGAIHRHGGPAIMAETAEKYPDGCPTGSAVITGAGKLSAKYVIHAVGPVWSGGKRREGELLAAALRRSLEVAMEHDCQSIAFPALSTGAYRFPLDQAAEIGLRTAAEFLRVNEQPKLVRFVLFDQGALSVFEQAMQRLQEGT
jgi:O-acetyl-ADP-ribose deacetylase (regulator of RNase III)